MCCVAKIRKGDASKILGVTFGTKLVMYDAVVLIVVESRVLLRMLMRARPFYSVAAI